MGLAGGDNKRNTQAIAIFALLLSFASFSFVNLVTRPVACFPGDIGTSKCPVSAGQPDSGTAKMVFAPGTLENCTCIFNVPIIFHQTFSKPPSIVLTLMNDSACAGGVCTPYLTSQALSLTDSHTILTSGNVAETWATMPVALTEIFGNTRNRDYMGNDLSATAYGLEVNVVTAGSASAVLEVQFSPDQTTWTDPAAGSCDLSIATTGLKTVNGFPCFLTANTYNYVRIVGINGNGVASPSFGLISVQLTTTINPAVTLKVCETKNPPGNFIGCDGTLSTGITTTQFDYAIALTLAPTLKTTFVIQWHAVPCQQANCAAA